MYPISCVSRGATRGMGRLLTAKKQAPATTFDTGLLDRQAAAEKASEGMLQVITHGTTPGVRKLVEAASP